jgi:biotin--protein ligase
MRAHTAVLPEGAVLVADQQTRGKGRGGNVWTSPDGCLMFTAMRRLQVRKYCFLSHTKKLHVTHQIDCPTLQRKAVPATEQRKTSSSTLARCRARS